MSYVWEESFDVPLNVIIDSTITIRGLRKSCLG